MDNLAEKIAQGKVDPTRTKTFRDAWSGEMSRRFRNIKGDVRAALIDADVLGAISGGNKSSAAGLDRRAWADMNASEQMRRFDEWLTERFRLPGRPLEETGDGNLWLRDKVVYAYNTGVKRGISEMAKLDNTGDDPYKNVTLPSGNFRRFTRQNTVDMLVQRVANELTSLVEQTKQQMVRRFSDSVIGNAQQRVQNADPGPYETASRVNERVDKVGIVRGRMIARTETVRAHHEGTLDAYAVAGIVEVRINAEWTTAGDASVCPYCASMGGSVFSLDEMRGMIPAHVLCRCIALPVAKETSGVPLIPFPLPDEDEEKES